MALKASLKGHLMDLNMEEVREAFALLRARQDLLAKEIKKSFKGVIPLAERNEWHDYFDAEQRKSADLSQQLVQLENQLNQEVYALFQLTKEEVALLESNLSI